MATPESQIPLTVYLARRRLQRLEVDCNPPSKCLQLNDITAVVNTWSKLARKRGAPGEKAFHVFHYEEDITDFTAAIGWRSPLLDGPLRAYDEVDFVVLSWMDVVPDEGVKEGDSASHELVIEEEEASTEISLEKRGRVMGVTSLLRMIAPPNNWHPVDNPYYVHPVIVTPVVAQATPERQQEVEMDPHLHLLLRNVEQHQAKHESPEDARVRREQAARRYPEEGRRQDRFNNGPGGYDSDSRPNSRINSGPGGRDAYGAAPSAGLARTLDGEVRIKQERIEEGPEWARTASGGGVARAGRDFSLLTGSSSGISMEEVRDVILAQRRAALLGLHRDEELSVPEQEPLALLPLATRGLVGSHLAIREEHLPIGAVGQGQVLTADLRASPKHEGPRRLEQQRASLYPNTTLPPRAVRRYRPDGSLIFTSGASGEQIPLSRQRHIYTTTRASTAEEAVAAEISAVLYHPQFDMANLSSPGVLHCHQFATPLDPLREQIHGRRRCLILLEYSTVRITRLITM